jgi:hypothetical protein
MIFFVPRGALGALLKSYCPKMCVAAESLGLVLHVLSIFNAMTAWGIILSDKCVSISGKAGSQILQLPLGYNSPPWGDNAVCV